MKKSPLSCPVCRNELDLRTDEYECVQVTERSCRVLDVRSVRADTQGIVYFVHPDHFERLAEMVGAGSAPGQGSRG